MINTISDSYSDAFDKQILYHERFRALLLAGLLFFLLCAALFNYFFLYDFFLKVFKSTTSFLWIIIIVCLVALRSLLISKILSNRIKKHQKAIPALRYMNSILEVTVPTVLIIILVNTTLSRMAFVTPATFLYFIFIFMSVLELDFKISAYTGFTGSLQFLSVALYYHYKLPFSDDILILNQTPFFVAVALFLFVSGIAAGMIARQIKKRINHSLKALDDRNRIEKLFGQQVSTKIVNEILTSENVLQGKKRKICVMFLDIRGFTPFCDGKTPEQIIQYQNMLFPFMVDIIYENDGVINQFMGDGFMATFGVPVEHDYDCANAVDSAFKIYNEVRRKSETQEIPDTNVRIGLHYGEVVTGNVGTETRQQYSITGNTVILAARLEQLNKVFGTSILISREVWEKIDRSKYKFENFGPVDVKGRSQPVEVFKLV